jgi:hypothetical protein
MSSVAEKFWIEDPCVLFTNLRPFPLASMSKDEKLNALTRLSILASAVMYYLKFEHWLTFLLLSILAIILLKYAGKGCSGSSNEHKKEDFTLVPTFASPDMHTTTVAPIFSEEWQIYPPSYDLYTNTAPEVKFEEPMMPQSYPYGQYLTRTNLLPSDEYATHMLNGGPRQAREYVNGSFIRHDLAYRDNMSRLYKKKLARRFRSNGNDTFSPFSSY